MDIAAKETLPERIPAFTELHLYMECLSGGMISLLKVSEYKVRVLFPGLEGMPCDCSCNAIELYTESGFEDRGILEKIIPHKGEQSSKGH